MVPYRYTQTYMSIGYGGRGKITSYTDANGNRTELRYDSNARLNKRVFPNTAFPGTVNENDFIRYTNDKNGNVEVERKRNGATITSTFDNNNRLIFKNLSDNTYSGDIAYDYDLRGLTLASCFGANASADDCVSSGEGETNTFDGFGNLKRRQSRMSGTTRELRYEFDLEGNRAKITHPDNAYFTYQRDGLNRVCTMGESSAAPQCALANSNTYVAIHYTAEGRRGDITRPGGASTGSVTSYTTDNALRLEKFTQDFSGTSTGSDLTNTFAYNPANQIVSLRQSNGLYNYAEAQNRVGSYGVNSLNQYTSIDGVPVTHDANGNLTADGTGMTYTYDMENHLVATGGSKSSTLRYDVLGRLARITVDNKTTDFHYDGDALVGEYTNGVLTRYVHGDRVDEPLVQYSGSLVGASYRRYLHADHQGSIIAQSTNSGAVTQTNSYDPYGIPGGANAGRFGYTGQAWLKELGLDYYKARIYAPKLGRFLQTDPIFYKDDMNLYAYVGNDPMNMNDASGKFAFPVHGVIIFAAAIRTGHGWRSFGIAWRSMTRDLNTQSDSKADVAVHKMSAPRQDIQEARQNSEALVKSELAAGNLGSAAHTIQDGHAFSHEGYQVWDGSYGGLKKWFVHFFTDLFPSPSRVASAYRETRDAFSGSASASGQPSGAGTDQTSGAPPSSNGSTSPSDFGMSGGNVHICSGMGAETAGATNFCQ